MARKQQRLKAIKARKNFLPTLILIFALWGMLASLIYFLDPDTFGAIIVFFLIFFIASLFTFSTLFANSRRGLLVALGLTLFIILRYLGVGHLLNLLLIAGLLTTVELYFHFTKT